MYRSPDDIALLTELAGVLDRTVSDAGFSSGTYLVLRELHRADAPVGVGELAGRLSAGPDEVAELAGRLAAEGLVDVRGAGVVTTEDAGRRLDALEANANEAMRAYVLDRPHTATVYGLVAAMQSGRFTVEDLLEFIADGPSE